MFSNERSAAVRVALVRDGMLIDERVIQAGAVTIGPGSDASLRDPSLGAERTVLVQRRGGWAIASGADGGWIQIGESRRAIDGRSVTLAATSHGVIRIDASTKVLVRCLQGRQVLSRRGRVGISLAAILLTVTLVVGGSGVGLDLWWRITGQYLAPQQAHAATKRYEALSIEVAREPAEPEAPDPAERVPEEVVEPAVAEEVVEIAPELEPVPIEQVEPPTRKARAERPVRRTQPTAQAAPKRKTRRHKKVASASTVRKGTFLKAISGSKKGSASEYVLAHGAAEGPLAGAFERTDGGVTSRSVEQLGPKRVNNVKRYADIRQDKRRLKTKRVTTEAQKERKVRGNVAFVGTPPPRPGSAEIDSGSVARVFKRRRSALRYCYEKQIRVDASLRGKLTLKFTIGAAGRVTAIRATNDTLGKPEVGRCIMAKVKGWRFPRPKGKSATFAYPMIFTSSGS